MQKAPLLQVVPSFVCRVGVFTGRSNASPLQPDPVRAAGSPRPYRNTSNFYEQLKAVALVNTL